MSNFSIFSILNTGVLGTYTSKLAMSITAHNIANVNTPGFSRQRPEIHATPPVPYSSMTQSGVPMMLGTGSMVKRVERVRDVFLDIQYREITKNYAYWDKMTHNLHYMEQLLAEPSEAGLRKHFDDMWSSFAEVMNDPLNSATIAQVASKTETFIVMLKDTYNRFEELRTNLNQDIRLSVDQINNILRQIADLNNKVRSSYIIQTEPNDLLDERDKLMDRLNEIAGVTYRTGPNGHLEVYIGDQVVVHGDHVSPLTASARPGTLDTYDLFVRSTKISVTGGHLGAIVNLRDTVIPKYLDRYDEMALMLTDKINLIHRSGFDQNGVISGIDFFKTMEASRTSLPNLFRLAGQNAVMSGPIRMLNAISNVNPQNVSLAKGGSIGMIDLTHGFQNRTTTTDIFTADQVYEDVIQALNRAKLLSTQAHNFAYFPPTGSANDYEIRLQDFNTYTGEAELYYRTFVEPIRSEMGIIQVDERLIDINNDGLFTADDLTILYWDDSDSDPVNHDWKEVSGFLYDRERGEIMITGQNRGHSGYVRIGMWKSETISISEGIYDNIRNLQNLLPSWRIEQPDTAYDGTLGSETLTLNEYTAAPPYAYNDSLKLYYVMSDVRNEVTSEVIDASDWININQETDALGRDILNNANYRMRWWDASLPIPDWVNIDPSDITHNAATGELTITDADFLQALQDYPNVRMEIRRWTSSDIQPGDVLDGVIDLNNAIGDPDVDYFSLDFAMGIGEDDFVAVIKEYPLDETEIKIYLESIRADSMHTDLGYYKMLLGKVHDGLDYQGFFQEELVNSLANMRDLLMVDTDGLLARMGFATKTQQFLEIGVVQIPDNILEPQWYYEVGPVVPNSTIGFRFPVLDQNEDPTFYREVTFSSKAELESKIEADEELNKYIQYTQINGKDVIVPKQELIDLQNLEHLHNIEVKDPGSILTPQIFRDEKFRSISFTVPVIHPTTFKNENKTFEIQYRSRDELIYRINNNTELNQYIKAFEHEGRFFVTHTPKLESMANVVTHDEFNVLKSATLNVLDTDAYQNLSNIMYSFSYASSSDYSLVLGAPNQVDLSLVNRLKDFHGKIQLQYATRDDNGGSGFVMEQILPSTQFRVTGFDISKIFDLNEDGIINNLDLKVFGHTTGTEYAFRYDPQQREIVLDGDPGENVDIVYWNQDRFDLNGAVGTTYTLDLSENAVSFANPANPPSFLDFKLRVQLPPDQFELTVGRKPIRVDMNQSTLTDLVQMINQQAPAGIQADLTPDQKLVFRAGRTMDFSFGQRLQDGRIVQMYDIKAPTIFFEKMGFMNADPFFSNSWGYDPDIIRNYLDPSSQHHQEIIFDALNIDQRQANGIYNFVNRMALSSQLKANPQLFAVDFGKRMDLNGDWISDVHIPRGGTNVDLVSIMNFSRHSLQMDDGRVSFSDYFGVFVSEMGIEAETAMRMKSNSETMRLSIDNERERVKGVSLDEEMSNMIKYQHAFNAAARVITAVDQMIQRVIDGVGMVGR